MKECCSGQWLTCRWHRLSMKRQLEGLQTAWWTCLIEVEAQFLKTVITDMNHFLHTEICIIQKCISFLMKHNGVIWHCARQSSSNNFFETKLSTPGITASSASVFTLRIMNDSQSAGEGGSFSSWYKHLKEFCTVLWRHGTFNLQQLLFGQITISLVYLM